MKTKIALLTAFTACSWAFAQENPYLGTSLKNYSQKVDSIVYAEKINMNNELDAIDKRFKEQKITFDEKQRQRAEIASKYERSINEKIDARKSELEEATREIVKNAVLNQKDSLHQYKNQIMFGMGGIKLSLDNDKKVPADYLHNWQYSIALTGTGYTAKDKPLAFFDKSSDFKNTVFNSSLFIIRYEDQLGKFSSPVFYRLGLGYRWDKGKAKYGRVFSQENSTLGIADFTKGNLKDTYLYNYYLHIPLELRFVLNPKYINYNGTRYLDNRSKQLSIIAGFYSNVRITSTIYNKYSNEVSKRIVEKETLNHGVNDIIVGGKLGIGYGGINVFVQKDFTPAFNNNAKLVNKYGLQIGIELLNVYF